jgi:DNA repair exonuclease SbcCD ATPase subunit
MFGNSEKIMRQFVRSTFNQKDEILQQRDQSIHQKDQIIQQRDQTIQQMAQQYQQKTQENAQLSLQHQQKSQENEQLLLQIQQLKQDNQDLLHQLEVKSIQFEAIKMCNGLFNRLGIFSPKPSDRRSKSPQLSSDALELAELTEASSSTITHTH